MDPINEIQVVPVYLRSINQINDVNIPYTPLWMMRQPNVDHLMYPVVLKFGNPLIDMPGCVEMHQDNKYHRSGLPKDKNLVENDSDKAMTLCPDGSYPSYDAMNYEPEQLVYTSEAEPPPIAPPPEPDTPDTPDSPEVPTKDIECPGPAQSNIRIGDVAQNKEEKVSGFEIQKVDGVEICVTLYEPIGKVEALLPDVSTVTTTATIATVATTSALLAKPLADLLMKVVKPVVKKVMTKIQTMLGKTPYRPTQKELKTNEYRVKKGLLGINFAKQHQKKLKSEKERKKTD